MHRFFYIFNQFNEIAKKQDTTKQIYKSQEKKTEKSIKNNNDKKVAGNKDLIIFNITPPCEKLKS